MIIEAIAVVGVFVFAFALISGRIEDTPFTGPMVFVAAGIALGGLGVVETETMSEGVVRILAEATLVLLLFTDAIRIDLRRLRPQAALPARLLAFGIPLTIAAGELAARPLVGDLTWAGALLLAAILTPTDAALGQAVVTSPKGPVRIRQVINVESGLNDGLMLPIITLFLAFAASGYEVATDGVEWAEFALRQIGFGVVVGGLVGYAGGRLLDTFTGRGWVEGAFRQLATLAVGVVAYAAAEPFEGNGFVAAFVAGLAFGFAAREHCDGAYDFAEDEGQLLALLTFLFFGATIARPALGELTWQIAVYALLSLTVVRMIPVAVSLLGAGLRPPTWAFIGWFGPRGLASILFGLFLLDEADMGVNEQIFLTVTWTVMFSVLLHGLSASRLAHVYGRWFEENRGTRMAEAMEVEEMPTR